MKRIATEPAGMDIGLVDPSFSDAVINWQKQHGRHTLPWQRTRDAYRVWLSEIMLQQTQVAAVIPYYARFLERFPDVASLAAAPAEDVMAHWSGLGYYSRARNLHLCAKRVMAEHDGRFPDDPALLEQLPGIGRSTAAAIAAFSYGARAAIMDGNVKRVFARVFGIDAFPGERKIGELMWRRATALLPEQGIEAYTQGLMDLGATVCTRSRPQCARCPLASRCVALATDRTDELPVRKPKKAVPEKSTVMLVITDGNDVLLEQRPDSGIWGGLLSLPEIGASRESSLHADVEQVVAPFGTVAAIEPLLPFSHGFTHYKLHVQPYRVRLARRMTPAGQMRHAWLHRDSIARAALPAPVKKLLMNVFRERDLLDGVTD